MKIIAIIPARADSKRLKNKNIHPVWNKPMLFWAIKACKESKYNIEPWVSTENEEIANIASRLGAQIHERDAKFSKDHIYKQAVIRSAAEFIYDTHEKPDIVISLQANSPEIKSSHLDSAIDIFLKYGRDEVFSVDSNMMQNAAFRIFKSDYVFQKDLSTNCGVFICDLHDVHTLEDIKKLERNV